jgi:hypothetical protein
MVKRSILFLMLAFLLAIPGRAQLVITQFPLNPARLSLDDLWEMSIYNPGSGLEVRLELEVRNEGRPLLNLVSDKLTLNMGVTNIRHTGIFYEVSGFNSSHPHAEQVVSSRNMPFGDYEICVRAVNESGQEEGENCLDHQFRPLTPPMLLSPEYCSEQSVKSPLFAWLPPTPVIPGQPLFYDLKICEVYPGQSYQDAIDNNQPHHAAAGLATVNYPYPLLAAPFDTTKTYVWQVSVRMHRPGFGEGEDGLSFRGLGVSEVWCFHWKKEEKPEQVPDTYVYPQQAVGGGYSHAENIFFLAYPSRGNAGNIRVSFMDEKGKELDFSYLLSVKKGDNRYELNLRESGEFRHKKFYTLLITNEEGEVQRLRFRYWEK